MKPLNFVACWFVWLLFVSLAAGSNFPLWGNLQKGKFSVGFKTTWALDYSRAYNTTFSDETAYAQNKAPRPILINIWYPALNLPAKTMRQGEYLSFSSRLPQLVKFSKALAEYERGIIAQEVAGKAEKDFDQDEQRLFEELLLTPTAAVKNAKAQNGRFPLIIYHSGYGSSIEDNSVLCEFLASHGYVVINSAFQEASGETFNIDASESSRADIRYLIEFARRLPNVDWNKIALMGHSGGAHTVNTFQALGNSAADVLVSLDTTQDYHPLSNNLWDNMTGVVLAEDNIPNMRLPTLVVAGRIAIFEMFDKLKDSERYYLTMQNMEHNDYISQGIFNRRFAEKLSVLKSKDSAKIKKLEEELRLAQSGNEALCQYLSNFFDAYLKNDQNSKNYLLDKYQNNSFSSPEPKVELLSRGVTEPPKYDLNSKVSPSPRQLRFVVAEHGVDQTASLLRRFSSESKTSPIYKREFVYSFLDELMESKKEDGLALFKVYEEIIPAFGKIITRSFISWGKIFLEDGAEEKALSSFRKALFLDPANTEAAAKIKEIEEKMIKSKK